MTLSAGRVVLLALLLWVSAGAQPLAQQPEALPDASAPQEAPRRVIPEFTFEEEEDEVPTLAESVRAAAVELLLFAAFVTLALVSFFRKSEALKVATLIAAVGYLGFYKSQLISIVNIFGLLTMNLPILTYNVGWYFFAVFTLASTILWGRLYCGRVCAFGALTQLMDKVVPAKWRVNVPRGIERRAGYIKYGVLAGAVGYFLATRDMSHFKYVEPFWMFTLFQTTGLWIALGVLLLATIFVRNLYCRFLCPTGAFLGLLSSLTIFRIKRWSECKTCRICEKTCEWGAIRGPQIVKSECVRCDDCERLYANTKKCPHWIILYRKADLMARQSATPAG
jgi:NosR/NirI family transcriptional regulator, nitrous oxide reductase regulator